jgi:hypothetical protein
MSLLDTLTGGSNENAQNDLSQALAAIQAVQTPDAQQLQLSQLAQYGNTGDLVPAQMAAAQAGPNALNSEDLSGVPMAAMQQALGYDQSIASANGMTPQEQAAIAQAEQSVNENTAGQRGAIAQSFAGEGVPQSLISAALQNGTAGQEAQQAYTDALQAQGSAANNALTANQDAASTASTMYGQQASQANTVASAQNALNQFNAANTQQANAANQATQQAANTYNTTNAQTLANQNVQGQQTVQEQNQVEAPQEAASLALQKAGDEAQVGENQANQQTAVGQQNAGLFGSILGAGATVASGAIAASDGAEIPEQTVPATNFKAGGIVPGQARVAGDSPKNDTVPARLSPGEVVLPRSVTQHPSQLAKFLANKAPSMASKMAPASAHPSDVASVLRALSALRGEA